MREGTQVLARKGAIRRVWRLALTIGGAAAAVCAPALEPAPTAEALRLQARTLRAGGHKDQALPLLEQAVRQGPATAAIYVDLGVALADAGRLGDAETAYREALALSPDDPYALANLGSLAYQRGDIEQSAEIYSRVVAANPGSLVGHCRLGHALRFLGGTAEARREYGAALALEPATPREARLRWDAAVSLAVLDLADGNPARAAELLAFVEAAIPDHPRAHYLRARALAELGRGAEAERELRVHLELINAGTLPSVLTVGDDAPDAAP